MHIVWRTYPSCARTDSGAVLQHIAVGTHCGNAAPFVRLPLQEMEEDKAKLEAANADLKKNSTELLARAHALEQSLSEAQARAAEPRAPQLRLLDCRQGALLRYSQYSRCRCRMG